MSIDVIVWLNNKLSSPWSSTNVSYLLSTELLEGIAEKFTLVDSQIQSRILFSLLFCPEKAKSEASDAILRIISAGKSSDDEWVRFSAYFACKKMGFSDELDNQHIKNAAEAILSSVDPSSQEKEISLSFLPSEAKYLSPNILPKLLETNHKHFLTRDKPIILKVEPKDVSSPKVELTKTTSLKAANKQSSQKKKTSLQALIKATTKKRYIVQQPKKLLTVDLAPKETKVTEKRPIERSRSIQIIDGPPEPAKKKSRGKISKKE